MPTPTNVQSAAPADRPMIGDDVFKQIMAALKETVDEKTLVAVCDALSPFTKLSMDSGADRNIELATQAAEILRRNDIDEAMIAKFIKKDFGVDLTSLAMDSARRARDEKGYRKMFPNAPTSFGEPTAPRRREVHARDPESYHRMFPQAGRLG
jgi:hypothetical protein